MAKQTVPGIQSSGSGLPKVVFGITAFAFVALVIKSPVEAANLVTTVMSGVGHAAGSLMTFFQAVG